jgi:hypothetical protein
VLDAMAAHRRDGRQFPALTARRLGSIETMRSRHAHLVSASISGFGANGPYVRRAAHDINYGRSPAARPPNCPARWSATSAPLRSRGASSRPCSSVRARDWGHGRGVDSRAALDWSVFPATADLASHLLQRVRAADSHWLALGGLESKFWAGFATDRAAGLIPLQHAPEPEHAGVVITARFFARALRPVARALPMTMCV